MTDEFTRHRLNEAKTNGEVLAIRYHGGSSPGDKREIMPLQINGAKVRCRCYTSNAVKVFAIEKIEILPKPLDSSDAGDIWDPEKQRHAAADFTISEAERLLGDKLRAAGWHVEARSTEYGEQLGLYGRFKNGARHKHPKIVLYHEPIAYDLSSMPDGTAQSSNYRPRQRPWGVRGPGQTGTWADPFKAIESLLQKAGVEP